MGRRGSEVTAARLLDAARKVGMRVLCVVVGFRAGEVHRVLTEEVFPRQSAVTTAEAVVVALG